MSERPRRPRWRQPQDAAPGVGAAAAPKRALAWIKAARAQAARREVILPPRQLAPNAAADGCLGLTDWN
ncbi:MAG: hypothetical protein MZV49_23310 [Rhodopseudomonas palustris]|nr:hypothetical protein [Rhodopseudomonas palustris]